MPVARPIIVISALLLLLSAATTRGEELPSSAYAKAKAATVEILVNGHLNGSGFIADPAGLVITAAHVVEQPDRRFEVASATLGRKDARLVAADLGHDVVLLALEPRKEAYPILQVADRSPSAGAAVYILGTPLYRHNLLATGIVSSTDTVFEYYADRFNELVPIAATIPRGMSGGPWLNVEGEVFGVQSGIMSQSGAPIGMAFATPPAAIRNLLQRKKSSATPTLGLIVEELWSQDRKLLDRFGLKAEGLVVKFLVPDGPAARAGLRETDLIVAADGKPVHRIVELMQIVLAHQPGQSLELTLQRPDGAGETKAHVILAKLEVAWP